MERIEIRDGGIWICDLVVEDEVAVGLVASKPKEDRAELLRRLIQLGAQGVITMGVGFDLAELDDHLQRSAGAATLEVGRAIRAEADELLQKLGASLDPKLADSLTSTAVGHVAAELRDIVSELDLDDRNGAAARLVEQLEAMAAPDGALARRLESMLDPSTDGSPLRKLADELRRELTEVRRLVARQEGAAAEAVRGTAKGFDYEDVVELATRQIAAKLGGAIVERTSARAGDHGDLVGDLTVDLDAGRIVIEAKDHQSISLNGKGGILFELDRALANRGADFAIGVAKSEAFPQEVGRFWAQGNRLLVVDEGDGLLLEAAIRWALASMSRPREDIELVDKEAMAEALSRIGQLGRRISNAKRTLTGIAGSASQLNQDLEELRSELLEQVNDAMRRLHRPGGSPAVRSIA